MQRVWQRMTETLDRVLPPESPRRKILQLISVILLVEGISVLVFFSYVSVLLGLASVLIGGALVLLLFRTDSQMQAKLDETPGMRLVSFFERTVGGAYAFMVIGAVLVVLVVVYNMFVSESPDYGDVDLICMLFGGLLIIYPLVPGQWKIEATFALIFLGFVVLFLAAPQAIMSIGGGGETSSVGNWYVHYMLAAPFSTILDLVGIPSDSVGNLVTLQFHDGSIHTLTISAYCAGLYSFSIFLSAFFSYALVLERLSKCVLMIVLGLGILVAYLGNLVRMVVVGVVGYYRGVEALHWAHENAGWIIFISWSALFWWLILGHIAKVPGDRFEEP